MRSPRRHGPEGRHRPRDDSIAPAQARTRACGRPALGRAGAGASGRVRATAAPMILASRTRSASLSESVR